MVLVVFGARLLLRPLETPSARVTQTTAGLLPNHVNKVGPW